MLLEQLARNKSTIVSNNTFRARILENDIRTFVLMFGVLVEWKPLSL